MKVVKDTPFEFGYLVWQLRPPQPSLTVIVKATFAIVPDGVCAIAPEQVRTTGPVHYDDDPGNSLRFDSDFATFKPRGECYLVGTCHPPGGQPVPTSAVSFRVGAVKKSLAVIGDRHWAGGMFAAPTRPTPFTAMPLSYERAFGGPGFDRNPVGRGLAEVDTPQGRVRLLPNIENPLDLITAPGDRPEPAGAFPIPPTWKPRSGRAGTYDQRWLETRWPWLPTDFDWAYFNACPADQQIEGYWRGDEEIGMQNMHPNHPRLRSRLPGLRAGCFLEVAEGGALRFVRVPLNLDTVVLDGDAMQVQCLWRGAIEVPSETLAEVATMFLVHEPLDARGALDDYRAWLDRKRREAAADDAGFEPEGPDDEPGAAGADGAVGAPPIPPVDEAAQALDDAVAAAAAKPPSDERDVELALLTHIRQLVTTAEPPSPPSPRPSQVRAQLEAEGLPVPDEFAAIEDPPEPAPAPAPAAVIAEPPPALDRDEVLARHGRGDSLAGLDLSGVDLTGADLTGADLSGAILKGAVLREARLDDARLDGAVLQEADLTAASLVGASLEGADLVAARGDGADLAGAVLDGVDGREGSWAGARFAKASCKGADLSAGLFAGANFQQAVLDEADLTAARADDADFTGASMVDTWFEGASAVRARFNDANLTKLRASEGADFTEASLQAVTAPDSRWGAAVASKANFALSNLEGADFAGAKLVQANLTGCRMRGASFQGASLVAAAVIKSDVMGGNFEAADLSHADLRGANLFGAQFWRARVDFAMLELANVTRTQLANRRK